MKQLISGHDPADFVRLIEMHDDAQIDSIWSKGIRSAYLAGPMRGRVDFNYPLFNAVTDRLRLFGYTIYNPADTDAAVQDEASVAKNPLDVYMQQDLADVAKSDAVFVLPEWESSEGARIEVTVAFMLGHPVFALPTFDLIEPAYEAVPRPAPDLPSWLDFGPEERATDPVTGGSKGRKQAVFANVPVYAQIMKARVHGFGIFKYPDEGHAPNWTKGMPWSWMYDAAQRHLLAFWSGEVINPESGLPHLAHAAWMLDVLLEYEHKGLGTDDRPSW